MMSVFEMLISALQLTSISKEPKPNAPMIDVGSTPLAVPVTTPSSAV